MKDVCIMNQSITDKFKDLDDEQYQSEYEEHSRKMSIINSYEEEIKEVLFLSSGCVDETTYSFKKYGLGLSPDYISLEILVYKVQALRANNLNLEYSGYNYSFHGYFHKDEDVEKHSLKFLYSSKNKEYIEYFISIVNNYSKDFFNKGYFLRCEGSFVNSYYVLVTKDETWFNNYLRKSDVIDSWWLLLFCIVIPLFGWLRAIYSAYQLFLSYKNRKEF